MTRRQPTPARGASAFLARQFGGPSGLVGHVVTRLLARGNAGKPLSERKLAAAFGSTSRRWARRQITEAQQETATRSTGQLAPSSQLGHGQWTPGRDGAREISAGMVANLVAETVA
jgi:hypothetical protein